MIEIELVESKYPYLLGKKIFFKNHLFIGRSKGDVLIPDKNIFDPHLGFIINDTNKLILEVNFKALPPNINHQPLNQSLMVKENDIIDFSGYSLIINKFSYEPPVDMELLMRNTLDQMAEKQEPLLKLFSIIKEEIEKT